MYRNIIGYVNPWCNDTLTLASDQLQSISLHISLFVKCSVQVNRPTGNLQNNITAHPIKASTSHADRVCMIIKNEAYNDKVDSSLNGVTLTARRKGGIVWKRLLACAANLYIKELNTCCHTSLLASGVQQAHCAPMTLYNGSWAHWLSNTVTETVACVCDGVLQYQHYQYHSRVFEPKWLKKTKKALLLNPTQQSE